MDIETQVLNYVIQSIRSLPHEAQYPSFWYSTPTDSFSRPVEEEAFSNICNQAFVYQFYKRYM